MATHHTAPGNTFVPCIHSHFHCILVSSRWVWSSYTTLSIFHFFWSAFTDTTIDTVIILCPYPSAYNFWPILYFIHVHIFYRSPPKTFPATLITNPGITTFWKSVLQGVVMWGSHALQTLPQLPEKIPLGELPALNVVLHSGCE